MENDDDDEDFMTVKRQNHELKDEELPDLLLPASKRLERKALSRKASLANKGNPTKLKFDDDGVAHPIYELEGEEDFIKAGDAKKQKEDFLTKEQKLMKVTDAADKEVERQKRQEKKEEKKGSRKKIEGRGRVLFRKGGRCSRLGARYGIW